LAVPVIRGRKTECEKFAGADSTYTIESYIPICGRGIQSATSHFLSDNFSKMFNITYKDSNFEDKNVLQISCGITTRSIGIMLMVHGDDKGPIMPPNVAETQIVIIPIASKKLQNEIDARCQSLASLLSDNNIRVTIDNTDNNAGWKYNHWETIGVPLRIEIGARDLTNNTVTMCKRNTNQKLVVDIDNNVVQIVNSYLKEIQDELYNKAFKEMMAHIALPQNFADFQKDIKNKNLCYIRWCGTSDCAKNIKIVTKSKPLCIPMDLEVDCTGDNCHVCGVSANMSVLFGRSY
jgi:prolyl-tRNA synthetase